MLRLTDYLLCALCQNTSAFLKQELPYFHINCNESRVNVTIFKFFLGQGKTAIAHSHLKVLTKKKFKLPSLISLTVHLLTQQFLLQATANNSNN
jgi:hypothetical protein